MSLHACRCHMIPGCLGSGLRSFMPRMVLFHVSIVEPSFFMQKQPDDIQSPVQIAANCFNFHSTFSSFMICLPCSSYFVVSVPQPVRLLFFKVFLHDAIFALDWVSAGSF